MSKKGLRILSKALEGFFRKQNWHVPNCIEDFKIPNALSRTLNLADNRVLLMTEAGLEHLNTIVNTIYYGNVFAELANYSDIYSACRRVFEELLSKGQQLVNGHELLTLIEMHLATQIDSWTFAVPIFGIDLLEIDSLELGAMRIVPASVTFFDTEGVTYDNSNVHETIEITKVRFWLIGTYRGTKTVAEEQFRIQAELAIGMLAVSAASMYQHGATGFRIGIVMSPEEAYGQSAWLSWSEKKRRLIYHAKCKSTQDFKIDAELVRQFNEANVLGTAFAFFEKDKRTSLEEAITKAIYWYSDAHREVVPVMKLIKYWSCVETFFSSENREITHSVSAGLTSILVFGGFEFVPFSEYLKTKKRITALYGLRSRAVHGAAHRHVTKQDAAILSQWVAWMLINMIVFVERGYTNVKGIKEICNRLDLKASTGITPS